MRHLFAVPWPTPSGPTLLGIKDDLIPVAQQLLIAAWTDALFHPTKG
jgi:hypothetical protein